MKLHKDGNIVESSSSVPSTVFAPVTSLFNYYHAAQTLLEPKMPHTIYFRPTRLSELPTRSILFSALPKSPLAFTALRILPDGPHSIYHSLPPRIRNLRESASRFQGRRTFCYENRTLLC